MANEEQLPREVKCPFCEDGTLHYQEGEVSGKAIPHYLCNGEHCMFRVNRMPEFMFRSRVLGLLPFEP